MFVMLSDGLGVVETEEEDVKIFGVETSMEVFICICC
jgi:hypothetical protein